MLTSLRSAALGLALVLTPSCAGLAPVDNPVVVARTADQRAYALLQTYAATLEAATALARDPNVPLEAKRALGAAEQVATPVAEALAAAAAAYALARESGAAARRLNEAVAAAEAPIAAFALVTNEPGS